MEQIALVTGLLYSLYGCKRGGEELENTYDGEVERFGGRGSWSSRPMVGWVPLSVAVL